MTWSEVNAMFDATKTMILRRYPEKYQMNESEMFSCLEEMIEVILKNGMEFNLCSVPEDEKIIAYDWIACLANAYREMRELDLLLDEYLLHLDLWNYKCFKQFDSLWYELENMTYDNWEA